MSHSVKPHKDSLSMLLDARRVEAIARGWEGRVDLSAEDIKAVSMFARRVQRVAIERPWEGWHSIRPRSFLKKTNWVFW